MPKKLTTFTLWGSGVLDLRYADFTSTEVEIHAYSIMGVQTILLPPEVNVEIKGHGVMGGFDHDSPGQGHAGRADGEDPRLLTVGRRGHQAQSPQGPRRLAYRLRGR